MDTCSRDHLWLSSTPCPGLSQGAGNRSCGVSLTKQVHTTLIYALPASIFHQSGPGRPARRGGRPQCSIWSRSCYATATIFLRRPDATPPAPPLGQDSPLARLTCTIENAKRDRDPCGAPLAAPFLSGGGFALSASVQRPLRGNSADWRSKETAHQPSSDVEI